MLEEPEPTGAVSPVVGELLLEDGSLPAVDARREVAEKGAVDGATGAAGADQVPRPESVVQDVPARLLADLPDLMRGDFGPGPPQQPRVELHAADRVLHRAQAEAEPLDVSRSASKVRKLCGYSPGSIARSCRTLGVTQPAHSFSRGNETRSSTRHSTPCRMSRQAQAEPAGPPPTMIVSTEIMRAF